MSAHEIAVAFATLVGLGIAVLLIGVGLQWWEERRQQRREQSTLQSWSERQ